MQDDPDDLPPMPWRRRALLLLLAIATAVAIVLALIVQPGRKPRPIPPTPPPADAARCKPGQTRDCVGGTANVMLLPSASGASAAR
jgi:hypothetical protein